MSTVIHELHVLNQEADAIEKAIQQAKAAGKTTATWKRAAKRISHKLAVLHKREVRIKNRQHERSVQERHHHHAKEQTKWIAWS